MKMFSECSGECCVCSNGGFCLAGHGDDDFHPASKEKIIENLDEGKYPNYTEYMIKYLANQYGYIYNVINVGKKKKEKQLTNEQPVKESFGGYTFEVVVAGNCVLCGKRIDGDNIFLCKDCQNKQNAEIIEKLIKEYISKVGCCDECFSSTYCTVNRLRESRVPQDYCVENIKRYFGDTAVRQGVESEE